MKDIEKTIEEYLKDNPSLPFMENHKWIAEDGTRCSAWNISSPGLNLWTGDGGAKLILEAMQKEVSRLTNL